MNKNQWVGVNLQVSVVLVDATGCLLLVDCLHKKHTTIDQLPPEILISKAVTALGNALW